MCLCVCPHLEPYWTDQFRILKIERCLSPNTKPQNMSLHPPTEVHVTSSPCTSPSQCKNSNSNHHPDGYWTDSPLSSTPNSPRVSPHPSVDEEDIHCNNTNTNTNNEENHRNHRMESSTQRILIGGATATTIPVIATGGTTTTAAVAAVVGTSTGLRVTPPLATVLSSDYALQRRDSRVSVGRESRLSRLKAINQKRFGIALEEKKSSDQDDHYDNSNNNDDYDKNNDNCENADDSAAIMMRRRTTTTMMTTTSTTRMMRDNSERTTIWGSEGVEVVPRVTRMEQERIGVTSSLDDPGEILLEYTVTNSDRKIKEISTEEVRIVDHHRVVPDTDEVPLDEMDPSIPPPPPPLQPTSSSCLNAISETEQLSLAKNTSIDSIPLDEIDELLTPTRLRQNNHIGQDDISPEEWTIPDVGMSPTDEETTQSALFLVEDNNGFIKTHTEVLNEKKNPYRSKSHAKAGFENIDESTANRSHALCSNAKRNEYRVNTSVQDSVPFDNVHPPLPHSPTEYVRAENTRKDAKHVIDLSNTTVWSEEPKERNSLEYNSDDGASDDGVGALPIIATDRRPLVQSDDLSSSDETPIMSNSPSGRTQTRRMRQNKKDWSRSTPDKRLGRQRRDRGQKRRANKRASTSLEFMLPALVIDQEQLTSIGVKAMMSVCNGIGSLFLASNESTTLPRARPSITESYNLLPEEKPSPKRRSPKAQSPKRIPLESRQSIKRFGDQTLLQETPAVYFTQALERSIQAETGVSDNQMIGRLDLSQSSFQNNTLSNSTPSAEHIQHSVSDHTVSEKPSTELHGKPPHRLDHHSEHKQWTKSHRKRYTVTKLDFSSEPLIETKTGCRRRIRAQQLKEQRAADISTTPTSISESTQSHALNACLTTMENDTTTNMNAIDEASKSEQWLQAVNKLSIGSKESRPTNAYPLVREEPMSENRSTIALNTFGNEESMTESHLPKAMKISLLSLHSTETALHSQFAPFESQISEMESAVAQTTSLSTWNTVTEESEPPSLARPVVNTVSCDEPYPFGEKPDDDTEIPSSSQPSHDQSLFKADSSFLLESPSFSRPTSEDLFNDGKLPSLGHVSVPSFDEGPSFQFDKIEDKCEASNQAPSDTWAFQEMAERWTKNLSIESQPPHSPDFFEGQPFSLFSESKEKEDRVQVKPEEIEVLPVVTKKSTSPECEKIVRKLVYLKDLEVAHKMEVQEQIDKRDHLEKSPINVNKLSPQCEPTEFDDSFATLLKVGEKGVQTEVIDIPTFNTEVERQVTTSPDDINVDENYEKTVGSVDIQFKLPKISDPVISIPEDKQNGRSPSDHISSNVNQNDSDRHIGCTDKPPQSESIEAIMRKYRNYNGQASSEAINEKAFDDPSIETTNSFSTPSPVISNQSDDELSHHKTSKALYQNQNRSGTPATPIHIESAPLEMPKKSDFLKTAASSTSDLLISEKQFLELDETTERVCIDDASDCSSTGRLLSRLDDMVNQLDGLVDTRRFERSFTMDSFTSDLPLFESEVAFPTKLNNLVSKESPEYISDSMPALVKSLNNDAGIPKGDMMISLLNNGQASSDGLWETPVDESIWRCRTLRRSFNTEWQIENASRKPDNEWYRHTSVCVDVDEVRVAGGMEKLGDSQEAAIQTLKFDDLDDALTLCESVNFICEAFVEEMPLEQANKCRPCVASTLHNIGIVQMLRGDHDDALPNFEQATSLRVEHLGAGHVDHIVSCFCNKIVAF